MGLWKKIQESEPVGYLQYKIYQLMQRIVRGPVNQAEWQYLLDWQEEQGNRNAAAVKKILSLHPSLDPVLYGVQVERYQPTVFLALVKTVRIVLEQAEIHRQDFPHCNILLLPDGTVHDWYGRELIESMAMVRVVMISIQGSYIPFSGELTYNRVKAERQERERLMSLHLPQAQALLVWLQAALLVKPDLMLGFIASPHAIDGCGVFLNHVDYKFEDDEVDKWLEA